MCMHTHTRTHHIECGWCCNPCNPGRVFNMGKSSNVSVYASLGKCKNFSVARVGPGLQKKEWWDKAIRLGFSCENIVILCSIFET